MIIFPILFIALHVVIVCCMTRRQRSCLCINWFLGIGVASVGVWMAIFGPHNGVGMGIAWFFSIVGFWSNAFFLQNVNWPAEPIKVTRPE